MKNNFLDINLLSSTLLNRSENLFLEDLKSLIGPNTDFNKSILVTGAGGTIAKETILQLADFGFRNFTLIDSNENALVETVRALKLLQLKSNLNIRSICVDIAATAFKLCSGPIIKIDYLLHLAASKHVRGERDKISNYWMIRNNILSTVRVADLAITLGCSRLFFISSDKAASPANYMGATKKICEIYLSYILRDKVSFITARFANVLFSSGSLTEGWLYRIAANETLPVPIDTKRFFITKKESGAISAFALLCGIDNALVVPRDQLLKPLGFPLLFERLTEAIKIDYKKISEEEYLSNKLIQNSAVLICGLTDGEKEEEVFVESYEDKLRVDFKNIDIFSLNKFVSDTTLTRVENIVEALFTNERKGLTDEMVDEVLEFTSYFVSSRRSAKSRDVDLEKLCL